MMQARLRENSQKWTPVLPQTEKLEHEERFQNRTLCSHPSGRGVTAVLGPTNTGKTHLAIERMLAYPSGVIGLPLRLLAREVYDRIGSKIGYDKVSLITGEEKIIAPTAPYSVCTVEAMARETTADFVAIDEVQLADDFERGHIFTDRILHLRGTKETMLLGSATMRTILEQLLPGLTTQTRPRFSQLTYSGAKKITRLPRRSCIVAFSADEVYAIAEFIRRQRGGTAVVLGALSPRSRNAQVALYQAGEVDFLVATDAIGMGLNLDVDHIAFAQVRKFDGYQHRDLKPAELGQIAGRAGRYLRDGTFGVSARAAPFTAELVEKLEGHVFAPIKYLQWRSSEFDFSSLKNLKRSLEQPPPHPALVKSLPATDIKALELVSQGEEVLRLVSDEAALRLLWQVCALPDYRKIAPALHGELITRLYCDLRLNGQIDETYLGRQVALADNIQGDIDTLSQRIAHIRSWTYVANQSQWLENPLYWQQKTKHIEDKLSDALHERLTQRFVNRTTSILMKRLRENAMISAEISSSGDVLVEGHHIGHLQGFRFTITEASGSNGDFQENRHDAKALRTAAERALTPEYEARAERLSGCSNAQLAIGSDGVVRWLGEAVASLAVGANFLSPTPILLADEQLNATARERVVARIERFVRYHFESALRPLFSLQSALQFAAKPPSDDGVSEQFLKSGNRFSDKNCGQTQELEQSTQPREDKADLAPSYSPLSAPGRGIAYQLIEKQGCLIRKDVAETIKSLSQDDRASLRQFGVRFGTYHIFIPALLKPSPAAALTLLWALSHNARDEAGYGDVVAACLSGRTSLVVDPAFQPQFYQLAGYQIFGKRAVRLDSLEKLADLIRQALSWREGESKEPRPASAYDGRQFLVSGQMLSSLGVSQADMEEILKKLGYRYYRTNAAKIAAKVADDSAKKDAAQPEKTTKKSTLPAAEPVGSAFKDVDRPKKPRQTEKEEKIILLWHYQSKREEARSPSRGRAKPTFTKQTRRKLPSDGVEQSTEKHGKSANHTNETNQDKRNKPTKQPASLRNRQRHKQGHNMDERENTGSRTQNRHHDRKQKNNRGSTRVEKPIDPDSPFAKLAALREQLRK